MIRQTKQKLAKIKQIVVSKTEVFKESMDKLWITQKQSQKNTAM